MNERTIREVVAHFGDKQAFENAVERLVEAGFERDALSVLASHDSMEVADAADHPTTTWLSALTGEVKYVGPLTTAGLIALASGPTGFFIAGLIAAGVAGVAAKEFLDDMTAAEHADDFAHAFETGGVILWVRVSGALQESEARTILAAAGGDAIHLHERTKHEA